MARTQRLKKSAGAPTGRTALIGRETAYHGDVAGHQKIMQALGAVPELNDMLPRHDGAAAADHGEARWPALKTFFFVLVFCSTAWATISAALLLAFR
ncbi:MAG TPA: hypothetical protein VMV26_05170 [Alphaproteobacteria bacterium]|jgi:hypothetical protein|nr:hypothetical protein [Alphaproteobacteria bacterium]